MSFNVAHRPFFVCAALFVLLSVPGVALGQNSCECGDPSLGTVTCEDDQEPFCSVRSGKVHGRCKSKGQRTEAEVQRWGISEALGREVTAAELQEPEVQQAMATGRVRLRNAQGKLVWVSFRPTKEIQRAPYEFTPDHKPQAGKGVIVIGSTAAGTTTGASKAGTSASSSAGTEPPCEVCVIRSGEWECKRADAKTAEQLSAARAELCKSDQPCLNRRPSLNCSPPQ